MAEAAKMHGIRTAPTSRRWLRRTAGTLALMPLLVVPPGPLGAAHAAPVPPGETAGPGTAPADPAERTPGQADPQTTAQTAVQSAAQGHATAARSSTGARYSGTGSRTAEISVNRVTPTTPDEDDTLTVTGTVTNRGRTAIFDAEIGLHSGRRLATRSAVEEAAKRTGFLPGQEGNRVTGKNTAQELPGIAPGETRSFTLQVPVDRLDLGTDGVYQLGVTLIGQSRAEPYPHILGVQRTFLPWQTGAAPKKTELTFVWPLISDAHLTARTESDRQQTPVFRDDSLAAEIGPGGRLQQLVALGKDLPVSWVVDPDLLATVDAMTKPYNVETADGRVAGGGQEAARTWLNDLQAATEGKEIVALPFGDPDLASLAHRGRTVAGSLSHLRPATEVAAKTVETILHTTPNTDFAWPAEGAIDPSVVSVATSAGARKVLTRSDSLRETGGLPYTPTSARPIGGGVTAVSADARLSRLFQGDLTHAERSTRAVQQFLAQTLSLTEQKPNQQRSIVVAPQRMPTASQARTMAAAIEALEASGRWTTFTELGEAAKAKPDPGANKKVPGQGAYPGKLRKQEIGTDAFEQIKQTQSTLDDFTVILSRDERVVTPFGSALRRALSTSWRGNSNDAAVYRESVQAYLTELTRQVRLVQKSRMTLSGRSATIPVTVQNNLIQPVDGLKLRLTSNRRIGLEIEQESMPVVVDGGHSQSIKFDTTAKANGRSSLQAQLLTADDKPYGPPMEFQVDVTEITSTVLLVIAGGMLLVVLAGVRMYTQRKRRGPLPDPDAPLVDPAAEAEQAEPGPGARATTTPDTTEPPTPGDAPGKAPTDTPADATTDTPADATGPAAPADVGTEDTATAGADSDTGQDADTADTASPAGTGTAADTAPDAARADAGGGDSRDTGPESTGSSGPGEKVDR